MAARTDAARAAAAAALAVALFGAGAAAPAPPPLADCAADVPLVLEASVAVTRVAPPGALLELAVAARPAGACRKRVAAADATVACPGCGGPLAAHLDPAHGGAPGDPGDVATPTAPLVLRPAGGAWRIASLKTLPTVATLAWKSPDPPGTATLSVPVGLMVENASTPAAATSPLAPFERPRARAPAAGIAVRLGEARAGLGLMGPALRVMATATNGGARPIQVDRVAFAAVADGETLAPVDNATPRPLLSWAPGLFFCLRGERDDRPFPDHVILAPGQHVSGWLCWVAAGPRAPAAPWDTHPPAATLTYGEPALFRAVVTPAPEFMGVYR